MAFRASLRLLSLAVAVAVLGCSPSQEPVDEASSPPAAQESAAGESAVGAAVDSATRLELQTAALADLYFDVRAQAAAEGEAPRSGFEEAVATAREIQDQLGSFGGWGPLDTRVLAAEDPAQLVEWFGGLEDPYERRGRTLSLRDPAVRLGEAMAQLWPGWQAEEWPRRRAQLEQALARLEEDFEPRQEEAFADMMTSLGIEDPHVQVPAVLLSTANPPGAMTYRMRDGPAVVVAVSAVEDPMLLIELLLHEGTHTLDLAAGMRARERGDEDPPQGEPDAFRALRSLLAERGVEPRDRRMRDIPHMVMFAQAGVTTRKLFDPDHVPYREVFGVYERTADTVEIVERHWQRYLDGEIGRDEALRTMVEEIDPEPTDSAGESGAG